MTSKTIETELELAMAALKIFHDIAAVDIGESEADEDHFRNSRRTYALAGPVTVGDVRKAALAYEGLAALSRAPEVEGCESGGLPCARLTNMARAHTDAVKATRAHPSPEMGEISREWRPEVRAFADLMEAQLRANDHKPGWKDDTDLDLFERLGEESAELLAALHRNAKRLMWGDDWVMEDTVLRVGREAADVANFALMIADVCGALKLKENGLSREGLA